MGEDIVSQGNNLADTCAKQQQRNARFLDRSKSLQRSLPIASTVNACVGPKLVCDMRPLALGEGLCKAVVLEIEIC